MIDKKKELERLQAIDPRYKLVDGFVVLEGSGLPKLRGRVNHACKSCSGLILTPGDWKAAHKVHYYSTKRGGLDPKPECYVLSKCSKKRAYYRNHERSKRLNNESHRYLKYKDDKCAMCGSVENLEVHHVQPQKWNGEDVRHNTLTLCHDCHTTITKYYKMVGWN